MKNIIKQNGFSALSLIIVGVTLLAIPLGVVLVQRQTQIKSKAVGEGTCRDNPPSAVAPAGFTWKADCSRQCNTNNDCPQNNWDTSNVNPSSSNWCYGFEGPTNSSQDWRCLTYIRNACSSAGASTCGGGGSYSQSSYNAYSQSSYSGGGGTCNNDVQVSFLTPPIVVGSDFVVKVTSPTGYTNIGLNVSSNGPTSSRLVIDPNSNPKQWLWNVNASSAGTFTYTFTINNGQTCGSGIITIDAAATAPPTAPPQTTFTNADINATLSSTNNDVVIAGTPISAGRFHLQAHATLGINNYSIAVYKTDQTGAPDGSRSNATWGCVGRPVIGALGKEFCFIEANGTPSGFPVNSTTDSTTFTITQPGTYKVFSDVIQKADSKGKNWKCYGSDIVGPDFACSNDVNTTMKTLTVVPLQGSLCTTNDETAFRNAWILQLIQRGSAPSSNQTTDCNMNGFVEVEDYNIWREDYRGRSH